MVENGHEQVPVEDTRDLNLAALLDVAALDEVTRRRLVTTALRSPRPASRYRVLVGVAAAVVVVTTGAILSVALGGGHDDAVTAGRSPAAESARSGVAGDSSSVRDLGTFGDVANQSELAKLQGAAAAAKSAGEGTATAGAAAPQAADAFSSSTLVTRLDALRCASRLPHGVVVSIGTAHYRGADAIVVVTRLDDGSTSIDAVVTDPCEVHHLA